MIGRTLGAYRIIDQIGMGGMATVYRGYDPQTDRYVAIKTLPQQYGNNPEFRTRFENEARAIARLEHIHILPVFAYGEEDGIAYMAMRYLDTGTLRETIEREALDYTQIGRFLRQLASALDYAHENNIIHRDVKPSNALVDAQGNVYLTDFGIAKILESSTELTGSGIIGTPQYMSPEQCAGIRNITPASDQYSLGVVVYEMVTPCTPYMAETPMAILQMHILGHPLPPPSQLRDDLPPGVERVILKALSREPSNRFPTCTAMAEAYDRALAGAPDSILDDKKAKSPKTRPFNEPDMDAVTAAGLGGLESSIDNQNTTPMDKLDTTSDASPRFRFKNWVFALPALLILAGSAVVALGFFDTEGEDTPNAIVAELPTSQPSTTQLPTDDPSEALENTNTARPTSESTAIRTPLSITQIAPEVSFFKRFGYSLDPVGNMLFLGTCEPTDDSSGACTLDTSYNVVEYLLPDTDVDNHRFGGATFSPDGTQIAFAAQRSDQLSEDFSGTNLNNIYIFDMTDRTLTELEMGYDNAVAPAWSPDGDWIATHLGCRLAIIRPDNTGLNSFAGDLHQSCYDGPQWSPDSRYLVATWWPNKLSEHRNTREIHLFDMENIGHYTIMVEQSVDSEQCGEMRAMFTPDGQYINYTDQNCEGWFMPLDGSEPIRAPELDKHGGIAVWWMSSAYPQWNGEANP